jgi:hypothetical protein
LRRSGNKRGDGAQNVVLGGVEVLEVAFDGAMRSEEDEHDAGDGFAVGGGDPVRSTSRRG